MTVSQPVAPDTDDVRERILHAAAQRFRSFGYTKTTMVEIATDCAMSAANIYRFFKDKQAIAVELARRALNDIESLLAAVVAKSQMTARERFKLLFLTNLREVHSCWSQMPRFQELVDDVCAARTDIVTEHNQRKKVMVEQLLVDGHAAQEFNFTDPHPIAQTMMIATNMFVSPNCMGMLTLEAFEQRLPTVIDTLIDGFAAKSIDAQ